MIEKPVRKKGRLLSIIVGVIVLAALYLIGRAVMVSPSAGPANTITSTDILLPEPSNSPVSTDTPLPTLTPALLSEPIILNGRGDDEVDIFKGNGPVILHVTYRGGGTFDISGFDVNGNYTEYSLVHATGSYEGTLIMDLDTENTSRLEITSSGIWEIQVLPFQMGRTENIPGIIQGIGDDVILFSSTDLPGGIIINDSDFRKYC